MTRITGSILCSRYATYISACGTIVAAAIAMPESTPGGQPLDRPAALAVRGGASCYVEGPSNDCDPVSTNNCQTAGGNYCQYETGEGYVCHGTRTHQNITSWNSFCENETSGKSDCPYTPIHCSYSASCSNAGCELSGSSYICKATTPGGGIGIGTEHNDYNPAGDDETCLAE